MKTKIMRRDRGYTITELVAVVFGLAVMAGAIALVYAGAHFIAKHW